MKGISRNFVSFIRNGLLLMAMVIVMVALPGFSSRALAAEYLDYLSFTAVDGDVTIGMNKRGNPDDYVLEYSKDRQNWTSVTLTDTNENIVTIPDGETYYFRTDRERDGLGNGVTYDEDLGYDVYYYWNFLMTGEGKVKAGGNVMSLLDPTCEKTSVGEYAFLHLFAFCNKLLTAPTLPAQTLADHCYEYMFRWCWSLTEAPELPAQELAPYCYSYMFDECGLRTTPELPALILAEHCYLEMFMNCWSLTTALDLPATDLEEGCYAWMFAGCRSLTKAPELPAQTLIPGCYSSMFRDCTKLSSVTVGFTGVEADYILDYCLVDWLKDVSETGTLYCPKSTMQYTNEELGLPAGWVKKDTNKNDYLSFTAVDGDVTIGMNKNGTPDDYVLEYSKNCLAWTSVTLTDTTEDIVTIPDGETYYFRTDRERDGIGKGLIYDEDEDCWFFCYWNFSMAGEGEIKADGNIMSLLDPTCEKTSVGEHAFESLFGWCDKLLTAPKLSAQTLASNCYAGMFSDCSSLTKAPELPAQTLEPGCYQNMFSGCDSLTEAPELPAQTLEPGCYQGMFFGCNSLTEAPELPAQTLVTWCYAHMFYGCSKLSSVTVGFVEVKANFTLEGCLEDWLKDVSETGTLLCPESTMQYSNEELCLPAGWVKKAVNAPEEPEQSEEPAIDYSAVYNAAAYKNYNPDVAVAFGNDEAALLNHFINNGMAEGRRGSDAFDLAAYKKYNGDLVAAFGDDNKAYYMHYINNGKAEGRTAVEPSQPEQPSVDYSAVYNAEAYKNYNPDVAAAFGNDEAALLNHFINNGMAEGRRGSDAFDLAAYKKYNEDVAAAFGEDNKAYYLHYINNGKAEGRTAVEPAQPEQPSVDYSAVYNATAYRNYNPDVAAAFGNDEAALLNHFINNGMAEGRRASDSFDLAAYKKYNEDVVAAFGEDNKACYLHYINNGKAEGRTAVETAQPEQPAIDYSVVYNAAAYRNYNPDVAASFGNDEAALLNHFINNGMAEGRQASAEFNLSAYKAKNEDLVAAFGEDNKSYYLHYINNGKAEGRPAV